MLGLPTAVRASSQLASTGLQLKLCSDRQICPLGCQHSDKTSHSYVELQVCAARCLLMLQQRALCPMAHEKKPRPIPPGFDLHQ